MTIADPVQPLDAPVGAVYASDLIDVDLSVSSSFVDGIPWDALATLRTKAPVAWHVETPPEVYTGGGAAYIPGPGFWAVTDHALVTYVSRHPDIFSSQLGGSSVPTQDPQGLMMTRQMMLNMDPPEHSRLRQIVQAAFSPKAIQRINESIVDNAREVVDSIAAEGGCDLVPTVAAEMPVRILAEILGMPASDRQLVVDWSNKLIGAEDPEYGGGDPASVMAAMAQMFAYGKELADARRANPTGDIVSIIANAEVDGERLTDIEFAMFWLLLVIAGNETTRNTLSGGVIALHEHDQWGRLAADPSLLRSGVEELLRYVSPVIHFRRTATRDVELGGQQIRAGDKVVVWYPSANRDDKVFDQPNRLDIARANNNHVAFGVGTHFCLGVHLARAELIAILGELTRRLPDLMVSGEVQRVQSNFIAGIRHLPVSFTPAA